MDREYHNGGCLGGLEDYRTIDRIIGSAKLFVRRAEVAMYLPYVVPKIAYEFTRVTARLVRRRLDERR